MHHRSVAVLELSSLPVVQKQKKNEFCVVELHVATSDVAKLNCDFRCGISLHVTTDLPVTPSKVCCATFWPDDHCSVCRFSCEDRVGQ